MIIRLFIQKIAAAVTLLVVSSCSLFNSLSSPSFLEVHKGMTMSEVREKYGKPSKKRFDKVREEWEYDKISNNYIIIFENERVVGMDTETVQTNLPQNSTERQIMVRQQPIIITPEREYEHYPLSYPRVMSNEEFNRFLSSIKAQTFDDERKEAIEIGAANNCFTGKQCAALMSLYTFDDDKMWVLKKIAPRLIGGDYWEIINSLSFTSSKEEAQRILQKNNTAKDYPYGYLRIMDESQFRKFISSIKNATFSDDKQAIIESSVIGNYFTCRQCADVMRLFKFDDEKMRILRKMAPKIVGGDYWEIIDTLTYHSSKEEAKQILKNKR